MRGARLETGSTRSSEAIVFTAFLLAFTLVLLVSTFGLRTSSAMVPRLVGIPLVALLCYRLIREVVARNSGRPVEPDVKPGQGGDEIGAILWLLALPAMSTILGFVAGPALFVFTWARYRAGERIVFAAAAAALTAGAITILFVWLPGGAGVPLW